MNSILWIELVVGIIVSFTLLGIFVWGVKQGQFDDSKKATTGLKLHSHVDRRADEAETDRLFYVACTRAADYLILSSAIDDIDNPSGPWLTRLAEVFDLSSGDRGLPMTGHRRSIRWVPRVCVAHALGVEAYGSRHRKPGAAPEKNRPAP